LRHALNSLIGITYACNNRLKNGTDAIKTSDNYFSITNIIILNKYLEAVAQPLHHSINTRQNPTAKELALTKSSKEGCNDFIRIDLAGCRALHLPVT
jgi:hypothetical protein